MALDAVMLKVTADELREFLVGARVDKIFMPSRDTVIFNMRNERESKRLLVSARSGMARVHFTEEEYDNPATPPAFCMLLRKYIQSGRVKDIKTIDGERILFFVFDVVNEMGDRVEITMSVELMGRYSNIVVVNRENRIVDALKHIDAEQSDKRQLLPGLPFAMPPAQDKLPFLTTPSEQLAERIEGRNKPLSGAVLDVSAGIGPVVCREIAYRVSKADTDADRLDDEEKKRLIAVIDEVKTAAKGQQTCPGETRFLSIIYDGEKPVEFSFLPLTQYENGRIKEFGSVSAMLDDYYASRDRAELMKARSSDLRRQVSTIFERTVRRQHSREEELNSTENADRSKLYGELLTAYQGRFQKGMKSVDVLNYYDGGTITIPLDREKTPNQNAQKFYRDYRKLTTARRVLGDLLAAGEKEIEYLESVKYEVDVAQTEEEFLNIRRELKDAGYLKSYRMPKGKQKKTEEFLYCRSSDGFDIVVGRNNAANDKLTLRVSDKRDVWFHVKGGAGSHTVLITGGRTPSDTAMTEAAMVAAYNSAERMGAQVAVDYTEIKNVKKAPGQKAGMVIYQNYQTAYVTPKKEEVEALLCSAARG